MVELRSTFELRSFEFLNHNYHYHPPPLVMADHDTVRSHDSDAEEDQGVAQAKTGQRKEWVLHGTPTPFFFFLRRRGGTTTPPSIQLISRDGGVVQSPRRRI
jgi:hypothetical protein